MSGKQKKNHIQLRFFFQPTPRRPLPSYNAAQLTCVHRRRSSGDQNGLGRKINLQAAKKKIYFTFFDSFTFDLDERNLLHSRQMWAAYVVDFSSKWETPIICHQERLRKNPLKIRIYSSFFSRKKEEIIIILEKRFHDTHK